MSASVVRDVDYLPDRSYAGQKDLLDIYMPDGAEKASVLEFFHGGAFSFGNQSYGGEIAKRLLTYGTPNDMVMMAKRSG